MGEVYLAYDTELDRPVAIKFLSSEVATDHRRMQRFIQEAKAVSALNHPNILTIYEIVQTGPMRFFVAEFVDGVTLREQLARRTAKLSEVLEIAIQITRALVAAHAAGIVHRDIKPENIMIRSDGYVKVLDFGLAKLIERHSTSIDTEAPTRALVNTDPGAVMGTVNYMSPEQAGGKPLDARTDIWSLGVVLYEMLTGTLPFRGQSPSHTIVSILDDDPAPLARVMPAAPEALQEIVADALAKDPEARLQTAKQFLAKLQRLKQRVEAGVSLDQSFSPDHVRESSGDAPTITGEGFALPTVQTGPRTSTGSISPATGGASSVEYVADQIKTHKQAITIAVVLILIAFAGLAFGLYKFIGQRRVASFAAMKIEKLTDTGKAGSVAISPDGKMVVHVMADAGQQSLWVRHIATGSNVQIIPPAEVDYWRITFSPDGGRIYFLRTGRDEIYPALYVTLVFGGEPKKLISHISSSITFSPDGQRIAFIRAYPIENKSDLVLSDPDGANEQVVATLKDNQGFKTSGPAWSPDGKIICTGVSNEEGGYHEYPVAVTIADGSIKTIGSLRWDDIGRVGWIADGSALVLAAAEKGAKTDQYYLMSYPDGAARKITNDLNDYHDLSLTADTNTLATVQEDRISNIWVAPAGEARNLRQLSFGSFKYEGNSGVLWTTDGRILYTASQNGLTQLCLMAADGTAVKCLTDSSAGYVSWDPIISPDGRTIVYVSDRGGKQHLWRMDMDGGNIQQLTSGNGYEQYPSFSPDGRWVFYAYYENNRLELFKLAIDGGAPVRLTEGFLSDSPALSPDGKTLAAFYREKAGSLLKVILLSPDGGKPIKTFDTPQTVGFFKWMPDGRSLAYLDTQKGVSNVWVLPVDGGQPRQLTDFTQGLIYWFDLDRAGKPSLFSRGTINRDVVLITGFK
jgi:eukaryotic-like serine/threonine-protein kinase